MNPQPQYDTQLTRPSGYPQAGPMDGGWALAVPPAARRRSADDDAGESQPFQKVHRLLRGRYKLAITLSLLMGSGLAVAGYMLPKPQYRSDGLIEIKPNIPSLKDTTTVMPLYTQYIASQVNLLLGQRVIDNAMASPDWADYRRPGDLKAKKEFVERIEAGVIPNTFLVRVSFLDPNPARARAAVRAMIRAYMELYKDEGTLDLREKLRLITNNIQSLNIEKGTLQADLEKHLNEHSTVDIDELHASKIRESILLQERLTQVNVSLAGSSAARDSDVRAANEGATQDEGPAQTSDLTIDQLVKLDPRVQQYIMQRDSAADMLAKYTARLGPNHPAVKEAENQVSISTQRLEELAKDLRAQASSTCSQSSAQVGNIALSPEALQSQARYLQNELERVTKQAKEYGTIKSKVQAIQSKIGDIDETLASTSRIKEQLEDQRKMYDAMLGSVVIRSEGDEPVIPAVDRRRQAAILGFLGGGALPFVFFMLVGLSDKRYRYSDETKTEMGHVPLLGILPNLPDLLTDPQQAAVAAHCVHQIRTLLQVGVRTHDRHVYAITSAAPGDGKTSLTLALGLSFAASGSRTLLIDCDLVGGSLTRRLGVHSVDGMLEAMGSRSPMDYVRDTDVENLSILPVGSATMLSAGSFSPAGLRRLIAEARKSFDIVLIDTGPILGSIEAPPVAATADATILCVSRGQQRPAVERSMHHLLAIGAKMAGIVFNRAEDKDFERSVSRFSQRSIRAGGDYQGNGNGGSLRLPGAKADPDAKAAVATATIDPVTRAVQSDFKGENGNDPR